ncbi:hypothetical protein NL676_004946 [Syzygium grande]|nr:hypothetical protein NL676_004946 [Syzygium grande]
MTTQGNLITQIQLKGENYEEWAQAMQTALRAKKKYGFIDRFVKQLVDDSLELEDWWTVNSMLASWVFNTIEPTLHLTISHMENVKDLWEDIKQRFLVGNGPQMQQLRSDLANCRQDGQPIVSYFDCVEPLLDKVVVKSVVIKVDETREEVIVPTSHRQLELMVGEEL